MAQVRYVMGDMRRIQEYIFGSTHLFEMRGASDIVRLIDGGVVPCLIDKHKGHKVFSGGGNFLASFPLEANVAAFVTEVHLAVLDLTGRSDITIVWEDDETVKSLGEGDDRFHDGVKGLKAKLRDGKRSGGHAQAPASSGYLRRCDACGRPPADLAAWDPREGREDRKRWLCLGCFQKTAMHRCARPGQAAPGFPVRLHGETRWLPVEPMSERLKGKMFPDDYRQLNKWGKNRSREMAIVIADVNDAGRLFDDLRTAGEYTELSERLEAAVETALGGAIKARYGDDSRLPMQVLVLGGDELVVVVPGRDAFDFARVLAEGFRLADHPTVHLSVGVVLFKETFPFLAGHGLAVEVLGRAKRHARDQKSDEKSAALDFHRVTTSMLDSLAAARDRMKARSKAAQWSYGASGPFTVREYAELIRLARGLRETPPSQRGLLRQILSPETDGPGVDVDPTWKIPSRAVAELERWHERQEAPPFDFDRKWPDPALVVHSTKAIEGRQTSVANVRLADAAVIADVLEN